MDNATRLEIEIGRYVDGEMTAAERAAMERRLEAEPGLRRIADELAALRPHVAKAVSSSAGSIEAERLWRGVAERIAAPGRRPLGTFLDGFRVFLRPRMAAGVAVTLVLVGLFILFAQLTGGKAVAEVTEIEYGENPDVVVSVGEDATDGTPIVWIDGIVTDEVN